MVHRALCPGIPTIVTSIIVNTIDEYFPPKSTGSHRKLKTIEALHYCFIVLRSGMPWRTLEYCMHHNATWYTVFYRFNQWNKKNVFQKAYERILAIYNKRRALKNPIHMMFADTSFIKNIFGTDCLGPSPVDRSRNATKISTICDDLGVVHSLSFHPANKNDCRTLRHTLNKRHRTYWSGKSLCADKGYDTHNCREWLHHNGMIDHIMKKQSIEPAREVAINNQRMIVENVYAWLDKSRRLLLRYEKMISTYRSFTYMALSSVTGRRL